MAICRAGAGFMIALTVTVVQQIQRVGAVSWSRVLWSSRSARGDFVSRSETTTFAAFAAAGGDGCRGDRAADRVVTRPCIPNSLTRIWKETFVPGARSG
jgi:hypothetical protein